MTRREKIEAMLADDPGDVFLRYSLAMELDKEGNCDASLATFAELTGSEPPYVPAFFMAVLLVRTISDTPSPSSTLGMLFLGLVFGLFAEHGCLSSTISDLAIGGIMLCLGALFVPPQKVLVPAEVQLEKPLA